jgi:inner membrane protein
MPTVVTHAAVGLGAAQLSASQPMPPLYWGLAAGVSMLPDLDVIAFSLGIPYGARFGHRGFSHSLCCAALVGLLAAFLCRGPCPEPWWKLWLFFATVMASHGILDMLTNGGMGIALFAPFDPSRYFFLWRPIQVAMIGVSFFNWWNIRAFLSELVWVWLPLAALVGGVTLYRSMSW